jgi:uncharacterized protein (TIGR03067 family)
VEAPKTIQDQILGEWQFDKVEIGGGGVVDQPKGEARIIHFQRSEMLAYVNGQLREQDGASYKLDIKANPVAIDLYPKTGQDTPMRGILKMEGDLLVICFSIRGERPTQFATNATDLTALMYLKRVKR